MTRIFLAAGVAALAIAAPAMAQGNGKGQGHSGKAAKVERAGGGGGGKAARADRGGGHKSHAMRIERSGGDRKGHAMRIERSGGDRKGHGARIERSGGHRFASFQRSDDRGHGKVKAERGSDRAFKAESRGRGRDEVRVAKTDRKAFREQRVMKRDDRYDRDDRRYDDDRRIARYDGRDVVRIRDFDDDDWGRGRGGGLIDGCPPGLAMKNNGCLPPGQAKKLIGGILPVAYRDHYLPVGLRDIWRDDDDYYYRYGDGYLYRVDRDTNLVASLLPLLFGGYMPGQMFPTNYMNSYVPDYYRDFYPDTPYDYYRYANGNVYRIDAGTGYIEDVIPMYGHGYGMGQMLPVGYDYYNVPMQYRDVYYDTDDYYYRYAPGAIYQVDRGSNLITAIASLLTPGFAVGQPLPMGYDAYNVPYAYRDDYYDTDDSWYRYNNGYIYQVDPTTRLITAIIKAIV